MAEETPTATVPVASVVEGVEEVLEAATTTTSRHPRPTTATTPNQGAKFVIILITPH
jgi:hypothetical protein